MVNLKNLESPFFFSFLNSLNFKSIVMSIHNAKKKNIYIYIYTYIYLIFLKENFKL